MNLGQAISAKIQSKTETIEKVRAEFNFAAIKPHIEPHSHVLDVGAWGCYLDELLQDRLGCEVLALDVVDENKTGIPFKLFDGDTLPVDSGSRTVVLLLYVLHHAANDERLLQEARRVISDDGVVLVAEDVVDGLWNRVLTVGFHIWLWMVTGMNWRGKFRKQSDWHNRFHDLGFEVRSATHLGHHLARTLWPRNILFVLGKLP